MTTVTFIEADWILGSPQGRALAARLRRQTIARNQVAEWLENGARHAGAVVIGEGEQEPLQLARRVHAVNRRAGIVLIAGGEEVSVLRRAVARSPLLGKRVAICPREPSAVAAAMERELGEGGGERGPADPAAARLAQVLERAPVGMVMLDADGAVIGWNHKASEIFRRSERESAGRPLQSLLGANHGERLRVLRAEASASRREVRAELAVALRDRIAQVELVCTAQGHGETEEYLLVVQDITGRHEMERSLRDQQGRLGAIYNQLSVGIAIGDRSGRIVQANAAFCRIVGRESRELVGAEFLDLTHPEDAAHEYLQLQRLLVGGPGFVVEKRYLRPDGREVWASTAFSPIRGADGRTDYAVAVVQDISDRKRAELDAAKRMRELTSSNSELRNVQRALKKWAAELSRSNAELSQFAHVASHDLKEPLRMVRLYVQMLKRKAAGALDGEMLQYIEHAEEGALRTYNLIEALLSYSAVARKTGSTGPVALTPLTRAAAETLRAEIAETGAELTVGELPVVDGDAGELGLLMQNLLSNAIKFRRSDRRPRIVVDARAEGEYWMVEVRDNGIGIAPQFRERIFVIFQRLHGRAEYPGTGIGLAICRKIMERHNGRIWVETGADGGAVFRFTLPKAG